MLTVMIRAKPARLKFRFGGVWVFLIVKRHRGGGDYYVISRFGKVFARIVLFLVRSRKRLPPTFKRIEGIRLANEPEKGVYGQNF